MTCRLPLSLVVFAAELLWQGCGGVPRLGVPLPLGALDSVAGPEEDGTAKLGGWVVSEDPIHTVSLYIDGRYVTSAKLFQPRADVNQAYPAFGEVKAGWSIEVDTKVFPSGTHELVVQARTVHGATRDLGQRRMEFRR